MTKKSKSDTKLKHKQSIGFTDRSILFRASSCEAFRWSGGKQLSMVAMVFADEEMYQTKEIIISKMRFVGVLSFEVDSGF